MKKSDWALVVLIVAIVGLASYFIVGAVLPTPEKDVQKVPVAADITSTVTEPSKQVFNTDSINPTVKTTIGDQSNQSPFSLGSD